MEPKRGSGVDVDEIVSILGAAAIFAGTSSERPREFRGKTSIGTITLPPPLSRTAAAK
jgi:hypothetical protein